MATSTAQMYSEEEIFSARPLLRTVIVENKELGLEQFALKNITDLTSPHPERKKEFITVCEKITEQRLGSKVAAGLSAQLEKYYFFSTADHHSPLNSSLALSANFTIQAGLSSLGETTQYIPVAACAGISLSNEDFPRGLLFHTKNIGSAALERLSLLPSNSHSSAVYGFRSYQLEEIEKIKKVIAEKFKEGIIKVAEQEVLLNLVDTILAKQEVVDSATLCEQYTKLNFFAWQALPINNDLTKKDLIYLDIESLVTQLILDYHIDNNTLVHKILFEGGDKAIEMFVATLGEAMSQFVRQGQIDTYLFWGLSSKNQRKKLFKQGKMLATEDGDLNFELTPAAIKIALKEKKIMPNLFLIYFVLHLYYSLNCLGGFNQIHYLDAMQQVYNNSGLDSQKSVGNSRLYNYGFNIFNLPSQENKNTPATFADLFLFDSVAWRESVRVILNTKKIAQVFEENKNIIWSVLSE